MKKCFSNLAVTLALTSLSGLVMAHQYDVPVPNLAERMKLAETGSCPQCALTDADLSYKRLSGADLNGATLHSTNFMRSDLTGARFVGADLTAANFIWADVNQADFTDANLNGALMVEVKNISGAVFCRTTMPDGSLNNAGC